MVWKILKEPIDYDFVKKHDVKICREENDSHLHYVKSNAGKDVFQYWFTKQPEKEIMSVSKGFVQDEVELMNLFITGEIKGGVVKAKFDEPKTVKGYNVNIQKML